MKHLAKQCLYAAWLAPLVALTACQPATPPKEAPMLVWVTTVQAKPQQSSRVFPALLQPRLESALGFQVGGRIASRLVDTGQAVKAGQPLAQLWTGDLQTGLQAARQQVIGAQSEWQQLQLDEARLERLSVDGSAPAAELERQRTRVKAAHARLEAARQAEQLELNRLQHAQLQAPFDGVVTQVLADAGQVLAVGQPMLMLARAGEIEAEAMIPEDLVQQVRQTPARLVIAGVPAIPALPLKVREVAPMGLGAGRQVKVRYALAADISPWRMLMRWGQTAEVRWQSEAHTNTTMLPTGALVNQTGTPYVWRVANQRLVKQPVAVLRHTTDGVVVTGLPTGTQVVSAGAQKLVAGTQVTMKERSGTHLNMSDTPSAQPAKRSL
jgi:membrane fusion protein, multidrug efflux system